MKLVPLRMACQALGMCPNTVRKYADAGLIKHVRNPAGQRLFDVDSFVKDALPPATICYCRVSSPKQKDDLARQVVYMRQRFHDAEIVKDIGSGLNFKRKGLLSLLDRLARGAKLTVVVAHKDRLARFGVELIAHMLEQNGGELLVLDRAEHSPERELSDDLLAIIHVFSCRMHGLHHKVAAFLVKNFDVIVLPTFETSQMVRRGARRLRAKSVRSMLTFAHYRFKTFLKHKAFEYGKLVLDQNEAWTSKTVSWTGEINAKLGGAKTVRSAATGVSMDRDYNGARGIFLRALGDQPILRGNLLDASAPGVALVTSGSEK